MALDVDPPDPPAPASRDPNEYEDASVAADADYRRDELADLLEAGAWEDAFRDWAAGTDVTERQFGIAVEMGLFAEYDFFWDEFADRVGYHAPGIPEDWREREYHPGIDSWGTVSAINAGLTELGQRVCEVLKEEYIDWETDYEPPGDLPDF